MQHDDRDQFWLITAIFFCVCILVGRGCDDHKMIYRIDERLTKLEQTVGNISSLQSVETRKESDHDD